MVFWIGNNEKELVYIYLKMQKDNFAAQKNDNRYTGYWKEYHLKNITDQLNYLGNNSVGSQSSLLGNGNQYVGRLWLNEQLHKLYNSEHIKEQTHIRAINP